MFRTIWRPAATLMLGFSLVGAASLAATGAAAATLSVVRGGTVETVTAAPHRADAVTVLRGVPAPARTARDSAGSGATRLALAGGDRLWYLEPGSRRATVCELVRTYTIGRAVVRCYTGR
jgi:endonuclease YncB( thermonuclease family)